MLGRLLSIYRPYWPWVTLSLTIALVTLLANVALMAASGWFITAMAVAGSAGSPINYFTPAALIRACAIVRTAGRYGDRVISHETTFRLLTRLRVWLYRRLEPLPPTIIASFHSGDLANRLRSDVDRLESVYLRLLTPMAIAIISVVVVSAALAKLSASFAAVEIVCMAAAGLGVPALAAWLAAEPSRQRVRLSTTLSEAAVESVQGMGEVLTLGDAAQRFRSRFLRLSSDLVATQSAIGSLAGLSQAGQLLASNLALWGAVVVGVPLVRAGGLNGEELVMAALAMLASFEAVVPLPAAFLALGAVRESAARLFSIGGAPDEVAPPGPIPEHADLIVSDVSFRYAPDMPPVLSNLSFALPQCSRIALLGPVGAGKSTVITVITGLLKCKTGTIHLGGRPLGSYSPEQVRSFFSVASQDAPLFTGTIRSNLLLARPEAKDDGLWGVLQVAQLEDFVRELPDGLDTPVGEAGMTLSGGQARRLAVARALLRDAPILVLDEPGEGLDMPTERAMLKAVVETLGPRSLLLITHRASGLDLMDSVVQLELPLRTR
ncbi:MAG: thiol reductant ABC exporter subunit CydC [Bacteroidota bacterium]